MSKLFYIFVFLKCILLRFVYKRNLKSKSFFYIGKGSSFLIFKSTQIKFNGRINIKDYVEMGGKGELIVGNHLGVNSYSRIIAHESIKIGENVLLARYVSILDHDHDFLAIMKGDFNKYVTDPIIIGNNVWIGDKVTITKGVRIGDNVIIGANSVVNKDIPSNSLAAGIPCKVIKEIKH
jgi:acetyltransferase-like isoleucine patch superfamily enzyme